MRIKEEAELKSSTSSCFKGQLIDSDFFAHEDMEQQASQKQYYSCCLNTVIVVPAEQSAAYDHDGTENHQDGSQILFEVVHCYIVLFVFSLGCKLNGFYPKNEIIRLFKYRWITKND